MDDKPKWIAVLEDAFGVPSQAAFGTAVFYERLSDEPTTTESPILEQHALKWYQHFCGETWQKFGPKAWIGEWKLVYRRPRKASSILEELNSLEDPQTRMNAETMLDGAPDPQAARSALEEAFDDPNTVELLVFKMGDGGAMSGLMIVGRRSNQESACVAFLLD